MAFSGTLSYEHSVCILLVGRRVIGRYLGGPGDSRLQIQRTQSSQWDTGRVIILGCVQIEFPQVKKQKLLSVLAAKCLRLPDLP